MNAQLTLDGTRSGGAELSTCEKHRFQLWRDVPRDVTRWWRPGYVAWVLLNPSTADATANDQTIRKLIGYSQRWGYDRLEVVNLFSLRSTSPKGLLDVDPGAGPENDRWILLAASTADLVVCGWGGPYHPKKLGELVKARGRAVDALLRGAGVTPQALEESGDGSPRHPLYLSYELKPGPWEAP